MGLTLDRFLSDAKARGKTREEAMAGAKRYQDLYGAFDSPQTNQAPFRPDEILNSSPTDGMDIETKSQFESVMRPEDASKDRVRRYFEVLDRQDYSNSFNLDARIRHEMGMDDTSKVDYVSADKYLKDLTAPYAKMKRENMNIIHWLKGSGAAFGEAISSLPVGLESMMDVYWTQQGAIRPVQARVTVMKNSDTGEVRKFNMDDEDSVNDYRALLDDVDGKASPWRIESTHFEETEEIEKEAILKLGSKGAKETSEFLEGLITEDWKESRAIMQEYASQPLEGNFGKQAVQFMLQGGVLVSEMAPLLVASSVNPQAGYMMIYSVERKSMYDNLIKMGVNEDIANKHATAYASMSAPIEYIESAGRLGSAFGIRSKTAKNLSKPLRKKMASMSGEAFKNIIEEGAQGEIERVVANLAATENNQKYNTTITTKDFSWEDVRKTAKSSLQMSAVLEAIGVPVRIAQNRSNVNRTSKTLVDELGIPETKAREFATAINQAESQEEIDLVKDEISSYAGEKFAREESAERRISEVELKDQEIRLEPPKRTDLVYGENGTTHSKASWDDMAKYSTREELEQAVEGEHADLFIRAVFGDESARAEYNALIIDSQKIEIQEQDVDVAAETQEQKSVLPVATKLAKDEILPLVEEGEQDFVSSRIDEIINLDIEDAKIELKRLHMAYPDLPKSIDSAILDAVNIRMDEAAFGEVEQEAQEEQQVAEKPVVEEAQPEVVEQVEQDVVSEEVMDNVIPEEERATDEEIVESTDSRQEGEYSRLTQDEISAYRSSKAFDSLPPHEKETTLAWLQAAKERGHDVNAKEIARDVISDPKALVPSKRVGLNLRVQQLENEEALAVAENAEAMMLGLDNSIIQERLAEIRAEQDLLTTALKISNTLAGQSLKAIDVGIDKNNYSISNIRDYAESLKSAPLTKKEYDSLKVFTDKIKELDGQILMLQKELDEATEKTAKELAEEVFMDELSKVKGRRNKKKIKSDREEIKKQLRSMGYRMNDVMGVTAEGSALIAKLAVNYIKAGANSLDEVVNKVRSDMPDASAKDVYDALSGRNKKTKQRIKSEIAKRVTELKSQANLLSQIEDAMNGVFAPKRTRAPSSAEVKRLRKQLRELQAQAENIEIEDRKLNEILRKIAEVEQAIDEQAYPAKKQTRPESERIKEAKQKLSELRRLLRTDAEIAELERRYKENDFDGLFAPRVVREVKNEELKKRLVERHALQRKLREKMESMRKKDARYYVKEVAGLSRALKATADMSYVFRQGLIPSIGHPILASKAFGGAFEAFWSENRADDIDFAMRNNPMQAQREKYGLHLSELGGSLTKREEDFASSWAEKIPLIGKHVIKRSERHMVVGLNLLRSGLFDQYIKENPNASEASKYAYAKYINVMTGRGELRGLTDSAVAQALMFSPKFAVSRIQAAPLAATTAIKHPELRKEIARQWISLVGFGLTALYLAKLAGLEVGYDPDEPDWGKIIVNDKIRFDVWGGLQQPARLVYNIASGVIDDEKDIDIDDVWRYFKYKASPAVVNSWEIMSGKDWVTKEDLSVYDNAMHLAAPIILESIIDVKRYELEAEEAIPLILSENFGIGAQVYEKKKKRTGKNGWD